MHPLEFLENTQNTYRTCINEGEREKRESNFIDSGITDHENVQKVLNIQNCTGKIVLTWNSLDRDLSYTCLPGFLKNRSFFFCENSKNLHFSFFGHFHVSPRVSTFLEFFVAGSLKKKKFSSNEFEIVFLFSFSLTSKKERTFLLKEGLTSILNAFQE